MSYPIKLNKIKKPSPINSIKLINNKNIQGQFKNSFNENLLKNFSKKKSINKKLKKAEIFKNFLEQFSKEEKINYNLLEKLSKTQLEELELILKFKFMKKKICKIIFS